MLSFAEEGAVDACIATARGGTALAPSPQD